MLDAPEDMAVLSGSEDMREAARENLIGLTGKVSLAENAATRTDTIGRCEAYERHPGQFFCFSGFI